MFGFGSTGESLNLSDPPKGAYRSGICFVKKGATVCPASLVAAETAIITSASPWVVAPMSWAVEEQA